MSKYRGLKSLRKYELRSGYKARESNPYRILELYRRLYPNPRQFRSSGKYQKRKRRGGGGYRSRLRNFKWPQHYQRQSPRPKYERKPKQNMSSPPKRQPIQYNRFNFKPEQNTEQMLKELEKKLDNKLSERLLEKLEAEFEELQRTISQEKVETGRENSEKIVFNSDMIEEKVEVSKSESVESKLVETAYKSTEIETSQDAEKQNLEQPEAGEFDMVDLSEPLETSGERKGMSIEGHIIDEDWIDEDGLNTLFWSEPEPEQMEQEAEVSDEPIETEPVNEADVEPFETEVSDAELFPPEVESMELEPLDEIIEPEEAGI